MDNEFKDVVIQEYVNKLAQATHEATLLRVENTALQQELEQLKAEKEGQDD